MDADRAVLRSQNVQAFLTLLAACEGTNAPNGYRYLFGSTYLHEKLFWSFDDHPRVRTYERHDEFDNDGEVDYTTAAGRYQITEPTFDRLNRRYPARWKGFGPQVQDEMALELIAQRGALADVLAGRWQTAVNKCAREWASLPSARTPQMRRSWAFALDAYLGAGGGVT